MGDRVWGIPQGHFIEAWNTSDSVTDAVARAKELAGGVVPRWAVMARAVALKKGGVGMKTLKAVARARLVGQES